MAQITDEIDFEPNWSAVDGQTYVHGNWGRTSTHGGGDRVDNEPDGQIAIYTGNWGGNWNKPKEQEHMLQDAKSNRVISSAFKNAQLHLSAIWNYQPAIPMMDQTSVSTKKASS